jgi:hypothetical protein
MTADSPDSMILFAPDHPYVCIGHTHRLDAGIVVP